MRQRKKNTQHAHTDYEAALRIHPNHVNAGNNREIARRVQGY
jgi:hypothetical protein